MSRRHGKLEYDPRKVRGQQWPRFCFGECGRVLSVVLQLSCTAEGGCPYMIGSGG
jgi:hypothetical protein